MLAAINNQGLHARALVYFKMYTICAVLFRLKYLKK